MAPGRHRDEDGRPDRRSPRGPRRPRRDDRRRRLLGRQHQRAQGRLRHRLPDLRRRAAAPGVPAGQDRPRQDTPHHRDLAPQRRPDGHRPPRADEARLRRRLRLRAAAGVRDRRGRDARRPRRLPQALRPPEQHHHRPHRRLRFRGDGEEAPRRLRVVAEGTGAPRTAPSDIAPAKPGLYFVAKDDVTQTNIGIVGPGIVRNNPDYYAVAVMNEVYGGGFSGRLMNDIRSKMGLAYAVGGGIGADWDHPSLFRTSMGTKGSTTIESVNALRNEINTLVEKPITADEVAAAKEAILHAFVFLLDSKSKVMSEQVRLEFYGYPADYWQHYVANIEKVTPADVERVAKKYINPNQLAVLDVRGRHLLD